MLDTMHRCKKEIDDKALVARCISRVNRMEAIVDTYQRTLDPHDFCPSMGDVCRIPDIRSVIIDGTDEEFDACAEEVTTGLPKLTSKFLEERTAKLLDLLPFNERPANVLSLATVWFACELCHYLWDGLDTLMHQCLAPGDWPSEESIGESTFERRVLSQGWCAGASEFSFSWFASTIARGLVLDCGEDPENITLAELNSKFHRFVLSKNGDLAAHSWRGTVSTGFVGTYCRG